MMQIAIAEPKTKIISLKPRKNPELEQLRDSVLNHKVNYNDVAVNLKDQVKNIHAAYLFSSSGKSVLSTICKVISSVPNSPYYSSWKDLGSALGLSNHELGCIEQYKFGDPTELVLKAYSQDWDSTLAEVISALQSIDRLDAIQEGESGLQDLVRTARQEQIRRTEDIDKGIYSAVLGKGTSDGILRPENISTLPYQLPITLIKKFPENTVYIEDNVKCEAEIQTSSVVKKKKRNFSKAVMLTFASDGEETAKQVAKELRKSRGKHLPIGVLLLGEHPDRVGENPEEFITHIYPQMHYIIPILTPGYFHSLQEDNKHLGSSLSSIDSQYVKFIHDLMLKEYIRNNCKNKRFRCIIPDKEFNKVLNNKHMGIDPVLRVYEKESTLENLVRRMLKIKWNDNDINEPKFNRAV